MSRDEAVHALVEGWGEACPKCEVAVGSDGYGKPGYVAIPQTNIFVKRCDECAKAVKR